MGDLFHEDVPIGWNYNIFHVMARCPQHTFMILTKRPDRMKYFIDKTISEGLTWREGVTRRLPNNIWLGVSVEDQATASERIPILLDTPAAVRFVSIEPMLENIELDSLWHRCPKCDGCGETAPWDSTISFQCEECSGDGLIRDIDWVIVGCESGANRRPCKLEWIESVVGQCQSTGIPCFVKQIEINGRVEHDITKFPPELQVREYPKGGTHAKH